jgi:hypothetical protein
MGSCTNFNRSLKRDRTNDGTCIDIADFFEGFKKGSKSIRSVLTAGSTFDITKLKTVQSFFRITSLNIPDFSPAEIKIQFSLWAHTGLKMHFRDFLFKFYNNILGINTRVSHFVADISRNCTFCTLSDTVNDETFEHLFFMCEKITHLRDRMYGEFFADLGQDISTKKNLFFGFPPARIRDGKLAAVTALLMQYSIWNFKKKKKIPTYTVIKYDVLSNLKTLYSIDKSLFSYDPSFLLSRNWTNYLSAGVH